MIIRIPIVLNFIEATSLIFDRFPINLRIMRKILIMQMLLFPVIVGIGQASKNVLFIGNSYTGVNNLPSLTQNLATSLGDNLTVDSNTPGGATFNVQSTNSTTLSKIGQGGWDYVILQAQSQEPSFPPSQVAVDTYPYAEILVDSVLSADPCAVPLFFMTWGRENGDQNNCQFYTPICTYDGMQNRLRNSYLEMGFSNEAEISPVGAAWQYVRDNYPNIDLYNSDGSHPSIYGSYLAACVHYASIFKKSPVGASFTSSLSASDALILQTTAEMIVIDSMTTWNFGVRNVTADFGVSINDFDVLFNYSGNYGQTFNWVFGDGNTSSSENPTNTYLVNGTYNVELIATNGCTVDTSSAEVIIAVSSAYVNEQELVDRVMKTEGSCLIQFNDPKTGCYLVYNASGQLIKDGEFNGSTLNIELPQSTPFYLLTIRADRVTQTIKLVR